MNKERAKRTFIVRTVIAILVIYVLVLGSVTYQSAKQKKDDGMKQVGQTLDQMMYQFEGCASKVKSKAVKDGLNLAKADRIMRAADSKIGMWDARKRTDSLILYKAAKDDNGNITGLKRVESDVHAFHDENMQNQSGSILILEDWFDKKNAALLGEGFIEENQYRIKGYENGDFFEPTRLRAEFTAYNPETDTHDSHKVDLKIAQKKEGRKETELRLETVYADSIDAKSWQEEDETWNLLEKMAAEFTSGEGGTSEDGGRTMIDNSRMGLITSDYAGFMKLDIGDYWLGYYVKDYPLIGGIYSMLFVYFIATVIFVLIGLVLIGSYCRVIDTQYETEERRRKMSDAMAHEMKTPLGIIKNYSEVLSEEEDAEKRKVYLDTIIAETDSMNNMIVSMLDLSKMEAGTYPMELSMLSVKDIAEKVITRTRILREKKNLRVQMDCGQDVKILADKKLLSESICNLMLNAINHAEENSTIFITAEKENETARFEIFNCGQPVAEKDQSKIWDSFYRGDAARTRNKGGNGLGLSIVKNACILHKGTCGFANKENGVSFWIEIPSQEDMKESDRRSVGPILNTEKNGVNLKGLIYAVIGTVIWLVPDTYLLLITRGGDSLIQSVLLALISIFGWLLCGIGAWKLVRSKKNFKMACCAVPIALASMIGSAALRDGDFYRSVLMLMLVGNTLYLAGISLGCRELLKEFKKPRLARCALGCLIAQLTCVVLWVLGAVICPGTLIGPAMGGLSVIAAGVNVWLWYDVFKRFHRRETYER